MHHTLGFKFIFKFRSKSELNGAGVELDNGLVTADQKTSCTIKPKSNLQNKKTKGNTMTNIGINEPNKHNHSLSNFKIEC